MPSFRARARLGLLIGIIATVLSGVVAWTPSTYLGRLWRGVPCAAIHPSGAHGASIRLSSMTLPAPPAIRIRNHSEAIPSKPLRIDIILDVRALLIDLLFWSGLALLLATRPRMARNSFLCAAAATALSCTFASEFCMDGASRGLPFPVTHPHDSSVPALGISLSNNEMVRVFDLLNLLRDLLVWSGIAVAIFAGREFARVRKARRLAHGAAVPPVCGDGGVT